MKKILLALLLTLLCYVNLSYALPFTLTPVGNLPTGVVQGRSVAAAYVVVNNTSKQLNNLFVKTPPHVSVANSGCGSTFNLAPGASCILNLTITGAVNGQDPNPVNHLYVCLPKGTTCAGTYYPLNVQVVATPAFAYIGSATLGGVTVCSISIDTGTFSSCTPTGSTVFSEPTSIAFSLSGLQAYVTDSGQSPAVVWLCNVNTATGVLSGCQNSGASGITIPAAITLNAAGTQAYITDLGSNSVNLCNVNLLTGILSGCADSGAGSIFHAPTGIALNSGGTFVYIANSSDGSVAWCSVNSSGQFSSCNKTSGFSKPYGIVLIGSNTQAYVTEMNSSDVKLCNVNGSTGELSGCTSTGGGSSTFQNPTGIALNAPYHSYPTQIYVANQAGGGANGYVSVCNYCSINCAAGQTPGELKCINSTDASGLNTIVGMTLLT